MKTKDEIETAIENNQKSLRAWDEKIAEANMAKERIMAMITTLEWVIEWAKKAD